MVRNWLVLSLFFVISCSSEKVEDFDSTSWIEDINGCKGSRYEMLDRVKILKTELKGHSSESIDKLLGKPDLTDLDKRHKLYYYYYLSGSDKCENTGKEKIYLQIRFNAINRADELVIFESAESD